MKQKKFEKNYSGMFKAQTALKELKESKRIDDKWRDATYNDSYNISMAAREKNTTRRNILNGNDFTY